MRLLLNTLTYRCVLRVLCPVRRPVATGDCVRLKGNWRSLVSRQGSEINFPACLWVPQAPHHLAKCCLSTQRLISLLIFWLRPPRDGSGPVYFGIEPPLTTSSVISFPRNPACPWTQYIPTVFRLEISFNAFCHCCTNGDIALAAWSAYRLVWLSEQILIYSSCCIPRIAWAEQ